MFTKEVLKRADDFMELVDTLDVKLSDETKQHLRGWFVVQLATKRCVHLSDALTVIMELAGWSDWRLSPGTWVDFEG